MRRPRLRREGAGRWSTAGTLLALLALVLGALGLLLHTVTTPWQWVIAATSVAWYLLWAAPLALVLAAVLHRWVLTGVTAVATALMLVVQLPGFVAATPPTHGHAVVVMQANLGLGNASPTALVTAVRRRHVDVLATEELTTRSQSRLLKAGLGRQLRYHYTAALASGGGGLGLWSRYPLDRTQNLPHYWLGVLQARARVPGYGAVTVLAVHLTPPYPYDPDRWRGEIARLRDHLAGVGGTVLAPGDYNATVDHLPFRRLLDHGYADAARQAAAEYLPTYPSDRWYGPLLAIDHILTRRAVATQLRAVAIPGSDHRALSAQVLLRR